MLLQEAREAKTRALQEPGIQRRAPPESTFAPPAVGLSILIPSPGPGLWIAALMRFGLAPARQPLASALAALRAPDVLQVLESSCQNAAASEPGRSRSS